MNAPRSPLHDPSPHDILLQPMNSEHKQYLSLMKTPARVNPEQAAWNLGFQAHDIAVLVAAGLLKPLGNPPTNGQKYFAAVVIDELRSDTKWLSRASDAIYRHWRVKNSRKRPPEGSGDWPPAGNSKNAA